MKWERRAWILESQVFKAKGCHLGAASFPSLGLSPQVWNGVSVPTWQVIVKIKWYTKCKVLATVSCKLE